MFFFGCPFAWFAKTQKSVSLSTAEAEYFGAMLAAKEAIFAREELIDLCFAPNGPTTIFSDSKSAVDMAFDPVAFKNTKHILRAAQFLRDLVARLVVTMEHIAGTEMIADMFTKPLGRVHVLFVRLLSLLDGAEPETCTNLRISWKEFPRGPLQAEAAAAPTAFGRTGKNSAARASRCRRPLDTTSHDKFDSSSRHTGA